MLHQPRLQGHWHCSQPRARIQIGSSATTLHPARVHLLAHSQRCFQLDSTSSNKQTKYQRNPKFQHEQRVQRKPVTRASTSSFPAVNAHSNRTEKLTVPGISSPLSPPGLAAPPEVFECPSRSGCRYAEDPAVDDAAGDFELSVRTVGSTRSSATAMGSLISSGSTSVSFGVLVGYFSIFLDIE